jgi:hypothetical protein
MLAMEVFVVEEDSVKEDLSILNVNTLKANVRNKVYPNMEPNQNLFKGWKTKQKRFNSCPVE